MNDKRLSLTGYSIKQQESSAIVSVDETSSSKSLCLSNVMMNKKWVNRQENGELTSILFNVE